MGNDFGVKVYQSSVKNVPVTTIARYRLMCISEPEFAEEFTSSWLRG